MDDILEVVAIAESTPGPVAINAATFVGSRTAGTLGAVLAFKKLHPIAIIGISAVIGIIAGYALGL